MGNHNAIALLDQWLADESGYDEATWPEIKEALDRDRLSGRMFFDGTGMTALCQQCGVFGQHHFAGTTIQCAACGWCDDGSSTACGTVGRAVMPLTDDLPLWRLASGLPVVDEKPRVAKWIDMQEVG